MGNNKNTSRTFIPALNILRFFGVFGVIGYHILPFTLKGGYLGVLLFFLLSGFLLAYRSKPIESFGDILKFYYHKIQRIYPPLIIMVFFTLGFLLVFRPDIMPTSKAEVISVFGGYNNIWQVQQGLSYFAKTINLSPFTHIWSLAVEVQFYLIWPFIIYLYQRLDNKKQARLYLFLFVSIALLVPMIVMYLNNVELTNIYYGTFPRIGAIFLGSFIGLLQRHWEQINYVIPFRFKKVTAYVILLLTLVLYFVMDSQMGYTYLIGIPLCTLLFSGLMLLLCSPAFKKSVLGNSFFSYLAKISYELYLWMFPVIYFSNYLGFKTSFVTIMGQVIVIFSLSMAAHESNKNITSAIQYFKEKKRGYRYEEF